MYNLRISRHIVRKPNPRPLSGSRRREEMGKKKRSEVEVEVEAEEENDRLCRTQADDQPVTNGDGGGSEKTKKKKKKKKTQDVEDKENGKAYSEKIIPTVTIAIPASIIDNAQSLELATRLAGQIARAATIYRVNEIVVFDNNGNSVEDPSTSSFGNTDENENSAPFFIRILRYLETPQYLRKTLFLRHNSLRFVGLLPPLDAPHHLRRHEWGSYREGVTLRERPPNSVGTLVDVGLSKNVVIDQVLGPGIRVTVVMGTDRNLSSGICHQIVPSTRPPEGVYWGYKVRYAPNLSSVIENCPFEGGYDHVIGTSEHGQVVKSTEFSLPAFRHLLIAFGGLAGLEESVEEDSKLKGRDAQAVFHSYLNTCPHQGSRTIRTEEAVFISLQYFQEPIFRALRKG